MARRTITIAAYNRPKYLRKVLGCLSQCSQVERWRLIIALEPGCDEVVDIARRADFTETMVIVNETRLGCPLNTYQVVSRAFAEGDFNVHIEDDILLSADALLYFAHCDQAYRGDASVLSVSAYNNQECGRGHYHALARRPTFTPWGWATWPDRFAEMAAQWDYDYSFGGWDETVKMKVRGERCEVFPVLARAQNIGAEGLHIPSPEWHETFQLNRFWAGGVRPGPGRWIEAQDWRWSPVQLTPEIRSRFPEAWLRAAFKDQPLDRQDHVPD